ncbi:Transmembrane protein [Entamoeba marina]
MQDLPFLSILAKQPILQVIHSFSTQLPYHEGLQKFTTRSHRVFLSVLFAYCNAFFTGLLLDYEITVTLYFVVLHTCVALCLEMDFVYQLFKKYYLLYDIFLCIAMYRASNIILLVFSAKREAGQNIVVCCIHALFNSYGSCLYSMIIKYCLNIPVTIDRMYIPWQYVNELIFIVPLYYVYPYMTVLHKDIFIVLLSVASCYNAVISKHTGRTMFDPLLDKISNKTMTGNPKEKEKKKEE